MHYAAVVGIKAQKTVIACAGLQRVVADRAVGFDGAWRVLKLVVEDGLYALRINPLFYREEKQELTTINSHHDS